MANKVEICGINTAQLPILSNKKMDELLRKIHQGDTNAREEFVTGNLRLVLSVVQRFMHRGENADDLFQVGCIGLMKAIDHFDIEMNVRFSTYAVPMVIGEIRHSRQSLHAGYCIPCHAGAGAFGCGKRKRAGY